MIKIELNEPFIGIDGKPTGQTLADMLGQLIGSETEGKTLKLYGWYKTLQVQTYLEVDESDLRDIFQMVADNKRYLVFVRGQLLEVLNRYK